MHDTQSSVQTVFGSLRPRKLLGWAILLAGLALPFVHLLQRVLADPVLTAALQAGSMAALATALGTVPVLLSQRLSDRAQDTLFGFGAGVMLAACAFSLIIPGLAAANAAGAGPWQAGTTMGAAILLGGIVLLALERWLPHEHFIKGKEGPEARTLKRTWLFVFAIALHNLPEGLAIGVAFAGTDTMRAAALATGIAIQDVPEGLVVALALHGVGIGRWRAAAIGAASGLVEPVAAVFGASVIAYSAPLLPWGLACAAGSMLFVVSHEVIPSRTARGTSATRPSGCCSASC